MTNAKILLLEEDAVFGAYLRSGLVELGCDVVLIRNGSEGWRAPSPIASTSCC